MSLIALRDTAFAYDAGAVVENLNFSVNTGDYLCVVGENGSGKSTLIKGLLHLLRPCAGEVVYGEGLRSRDVGYLPQQTAAQKDFPASVYEVVLSGRLNSRGIRPFYTGRDREEARCNMELMDVADLQSACYRELSGGQQQRVLLARALCATRRMLLLDEPVSGLDPVATADLYRMVADIHSRGVTVITVSHDVVSAVGCATHILHLGGRQLFYGTREEYLASRLGRQYLGGGEIA